MPDRLGGWSCSQASKYSVCGKVKAPKKLSLSRLPAPRRRVAMDTKYCDLCNFEVSGKNASTGMWKHQLRVHASSPSARRLALCLRQKTAVSFGQMAKIRRVCDACGYQSKGATGFHLVCHMAIHQPRLRRPVESFRCDDCNKTSTQVSHLMYHWKAAHSVRRQRLQVNKGPLHQCDECQRFLRSLQLHLHWRAKHASSRHRVQKPYAGRKKRRLKCDDCPSNFYCMNDIRNHVALMHT